MSEGIDREKLSSMLLERTPLTLETFEKIHGTATGRRKVYTQFKMWVVLKEGFPDIRLWRVTPLCLLDKVD